MTRMTTSISGPRLPVPKFWEAGVYVVTALTVEAEPTGTLSNVNANLVLLVAGKIPNVNAKTLTVITLKDATKIVKPRKEQQEQ